MFAHFLLIFYTQFTIRNTCILIYGSYFTHNLLSEILVTHIWLIFYTQFTIRDIYLLIFLTKCTIRYICYIIFWSYSTQNVLSEITGLSYSDHILHTLYYKKYLLVVEATLQTLLSVCPKCFQKCLRNLYWGQTGAS